MTADGEIKLEDKMLPISAPDFELLRSSRQIYVDKTDLIYQLVMENVPLFLSRPRRFGKSLLTSVFKSLFAHGLEYFHGLKIEQLWRPEPFCKVLELDFSIPAEVRRVLLGEGAIESDFNRLQDLPEVENIYLIGEFSVRGQQEEGELLVCGGSFTLERFETPRNISCFGKSGLPFYAGEIVARKKVSVRKEGGSIVFGCSLRGAAVRVFVNGKAAGDVLWDRPLEIAELLRDGENEIELHIYNDLRNLFGPDHNKFKEPHMVGFTTFTDSPGWCDPQEPLWTDVYYLKEFGVRFPKGSEKE